MFTTAILGNRASHSAIGVQSPFKILHETEPDLKLVGVIIALDVVHVGAYSKHHELKAVEGSWLGTEVIGGTIICTLWTPGKI